MRNINPFVFIAPITFLVLFSLVIPRITPTWIRLLLLGLMIIVGLNSAMWVAVPSSIFTYAVLRLKMKFKGGKFLKIVLLLMILVPFLSSLVFYAYFGKAIGGFFFMTKGIFELFSQIKNFFIK